MKRVLVGDTTFVSDSSDSATVTVMQPGCIRVMHRPDAIALYRQLSQSNTVIQRNAPIGGHRLRLRRENQFYAQYR